MKKEILITVITLSFIYLFLFRPYEVSGSSMEPNFHNGERVIINQIIYSLNDPSRGDVVIITNPEDYNDFLIKRIVALPGEKFKIQKGKVMINNQPLVESYLSNKSITKDDSFVKENHEYIIPNDNYLVLGDNRLNSTDSRSFGFISEDLIQGKVQIVYWPIASAKALSD